MMTLLVARMEGKNDGTALHVNIILRLPSLAFVLLGLNGAPAEVDIYVPMWPCPSCSNGFLVLPERAEEVLSHPQR